MNDCLFVSFWDLCLENLPDGRFEKRERTAEDSTAMIHAAVSASSVVWVSRDDLLAPYNQNVRRRHEELCAVLRSEHGWPVQLQDFFSSSDENPQLLTTRPLVLAEVGPNARLLIVSCCYKVVDRLDKKNDPEALFALAHDTVTFHLIEQASGQGFTQTENDSEISRLP